jgi:hypothetical protein
MRPSHAAATQADGRESSLPAIQSCKSETEGNGGSVVWRRAVACYQPVLSPKFDRQLPTRSETDDCSSRIDWQGCALHAIEGSRIEKVPWEMLLRHSDAVNIEVPHEGCGLTIATHVFGPECRFTGS